MKPSAQLLKKFTSESPTSIRNLENLNGELMMKYKNNIARNLGNDLKSIKISKMNKASYQESNLNNIFLHNHTTSSGKISHKSTISSKDIINATSQQRSPDDC